MPSLKGPQEGKRPTARSPGTRLSPLVALQEGFWLLHQGGFLAGAAEPRAGRAPGPASLWRLRTRNSEPGAGYQECARPHQQTQPPIWRRFWAGRHPSDPPGEEALKWAVQGGDSPRSLLAASSPGFFPLNLAVWRGRGEMNKEKGCSLGGFV